MGFLASLFGIKPKPQKWQPGEEELQAIFAQYEQLKRSASIAVLGEAPNAGPLASWFGGHGVKLPSEEVPTCDGMPMFPLLQVNCAELPYVPPALEGVALFVVWINQSGMEIGFDEMGDTWLIREYPTLDGLVPVTGVPLPKKMTTVPITWTRSDVEYPDWFDAEDLVDFSGHPFTALDEQTSSMLIDRFTNHEHTKIGGYPSNIQCTMEHVDTFVFQIGSEDAAHWNWCDAGILYFSKTTDGTWELTGQSF
jgi:uncharacterized protein YwqG